MISPLEFTAYSVAMVIGGFLLGLVARGYEVDRLRAKLADMTEARDCAVASMEWCKESLYDRNLEIMQSVELLKEARAHIATLQAALVKWVPVRGEKGRFAKK